MDDSSLPLFPNALDRRQLLRGASLLGASALAGAGAASPSYAALRTRAVASSCILTASNIQGPFYLDLDLMRKDITEGLPGYPLLLFFRVVDVDRCTPIPGAVVDIWHTEALGSYSGFPSEGTAGLTWMRGIQVADANGVVCFQTVYPGWYPGRTTHIHAKINPDEASELTTQFYFHDGLTEQIYTLSPYDQKGPKDRTNAQDAFYLPELEMGFLAPPLANFVAAGKTIVIDH